MVSNEYSEAIVEVLDILDNSNPSVYDKIPKKLIKFWEENKSTTYKPNLDHSKSISEMDLKEKTKALITMIYLNYLCDGNEKQELINVLNENEKKYQELLREKYNPDNIFQKENKEENNEMVLYKESVFKKIINFIKKIFK